MLLTLVGLLILLCELFIMHGHNFNVQFLVYYNHEWGLGWRSG